MIAVAHTHDVSSAAPYAHANEGFDLVRLGDEDDRESAAVGRGALMCMGSVGVLAECYLRWLPSVFHFPTTFP